MMLHFYAKLTLLLCSAYDYLLLVLCILCECVWVFRVSDHTFLNNYSCNLELAHVSTYIVLSLIPFFSSTYVHFNMIICCVTDEKIKP